MNKCKRCGLELHSMYPLDICGNCNEWDEKFETFLDFINDNNDISVHLRNNYFFKICNKYFDGKVENKVKIKVRKGAILIERVD